jgi:hypothetical protein
LRGYGGGLKSTPPRSCMSWVRLARKSASLVLLARTRNRLRLGSIGAQRTEQSRSHHGLKSWQGDEEEEKRYPYLFSSYLLSTEGRAGGFPGGGRGRKPLASGSGSTEVHTGRGILLLLPEDDDSDRGSSPCQSQREPRSDGGRSRGRAPGRLSQDSDGEGECVGEPCTGLLQRWQRRSSAAAVGGGPARPGESRVGEAGSRTGIRLCRGEVEDESLRGRAGGGGDADTVTAVLSSAPQPPASAWSCWLGSEERSGRPESLSGSRSLVSWAQGPLAAGASRSRSLRTSSEGSSSLLEGASRGMASLRSCAGDCGPQLEDCGRRTRGLQKGN